MMQNLVAVTRVLRMLPASWRAEINSPQIHAGGFIIVARAFSQIEETLQAPAHLFLGSYQNAQIAHLPARKVIYGCPVRRISAAEAC